METKEYYKKLTKQLQCITCRHGKKENILKGLPGCMFPAWPDIEEKAEKKTGLYFPVKCNSYKKEVKNAENIHKNVWSETRV